MKSTKAYEMLISMVLAGALAAPAAADSSPELFRPLPLPNMADAPTPPPPPPAMTCLVSPAIQRFAPNLPPPEFFPGRRLPPRSVGPMGMGCNVEPEACLAGNRFSEDARPSPCNSRWHSQLVGVGGVLTGLRLLSGMNQGGNR